MKVGFIGAGKVGFSLGKFFAQGGIQLSGYWSQTQDSTNKAALFTGSTPYDSLELLVKDSDVLFLTVPDGAITKVFQSLTAFDLSEKQICHCSGAMTAEEAFPNIEQTGAFAYSIHPLFPVSSKYESYKELSQAFFCIEGHPLHLSYWQDQLSSLGAKVQIIPKEAKVRYHAACAISSNLMCALVQESLELLESCGFTPELALNALTPLMRSNLEHIIHDGAIAALTGPVERNDSVTVQKHLNCFNCPENLDNKVDLDNKAALGDKVNLSDKISLGNKVDFSDKVNFSNQVDWNNQAASIDSTNLSTQSQQTLKTTQTLEPKQTAKPKQDSKTAQVFKTDQLVKTNQDFKTNQDSKTDQVFEANQDCKITPVFKTECLERELYRIASLKLVQIAQSKHPERDYQNLDTLLKQGD